jgi:O-acetyl-ADP-ribose deacetylase (regulator of RNase III)
MTDMDSFVFFDIDETKVHNLRDALNELNPSRYKSCRFLHTSFENLLRMGLILDAAISAANSMLFFDGGCDAAYLEAFPNIQKESQALVKRLGNRSALDRPFLPVGSAIRVETGSTLCPHVIAAPTMFFPEDITGTHNVRHAFWAALRLKLEFGDSRVAVPCMGMGYGKLSAQECAREIDAGFYMPLCTHKDVVSSNPGWWYVRKSMACRQPNTYANSEVQETADSGAQQWPEVVRDMMQHGGAGDLDPSYAEKIGFSENNIESCAPSAHRQP